MYRKRIKPLPVFLLFFFDLLFCISNILKLYTIVSSNKAAKKLLREELKTVRKTKIDWLLVTIFLSTVFNSATNPFIHKMLIGSVSNNIIAGEQIFSCLSIIISGFIWNKFSDKLFKYYPLYGITEIIAMIIIVIVVIINENLLLCYILRVIECAIITRNISCGVIKIKAMRYDNQEKRERFDTNMKSVSALATIIGSCIAMILNLDFNIMLCISVFGNAIYNILCIAIYYKTIRSK